MKMPASPRDSRPGQSRTVRQKVHKQTLCERACGSWTVTMSEASVMINSDVDGAAGGWQLYKWVVSYASAATVPASW
jgi:hypothetical protein